MNRIESIKNEQGQYEHREFIYSPLWYHSRGLMQTRTGFGKKLNSGYKVFYAGKLRRVYTWLISNSGVNFVIVKGEQINL